MSTTISTPNVKPATLWSGRGLSGLAIAFLLMDGVMKILKLEVVVDYSTNLEISERVLPGLGITLVVCTLLYAIPQTTLLGAILLVGYLGGAVWTHVRIGGDLFSIIFPFLVGGMIWGGLLLREPRLRVLFPWRR